MLYPKYRIFMDMEIPFLFQNEDIFIANNAFFIGKGLSEIIEKYHPSFIIVPLENSGFKGLITKHPEYRVVFFDETGILYVDKKQFPKIADEYELKEIDPYTITQINIGSIISENRDVPVLKELLKLNEIYPGCGFTNQFMAHLYNKKGDYDKSIQYTENIINNYPETPVGYKLKADALQGMEKYDNALLEYNKALYRAVNKVEIYREIGNIYMKQQKYAKAYKTFRIITDPFSGTDYKYMHDVCLSAALSGNRRDAEILYRYAYALVPPDDKEWNEKYAKLAEMVRER
jgi:tetratricopeptide (TPR) repeat protein